MTDQKLRPSRAIAAAMMMLAGMILTGLTTRAHAEGFENLDRLDSLVAMSLGANRGQPGGPLMPIDRRLHLAACPQSPTVDAPKMNAATVSCPSLGWRIRVPLVAVAQPANPQFSANYAPAAPPYAPMSAPVSNAVVVKKGDPVQLIAGNDDFSISRMMIADEDGAAGALIRVRQDPKAAPLMARVEAIGLVRIPGI